MASWSRTFRLVSRLASWSCAWTPKRSTVRWPGRPLTYWHADITWHCLDPGECCGLMPRNGLESGRGITLSPGRYRPRGRLDTPCRRSASCPAGLANRSQVIKEQPAQVARLSGRSTTGRTSVLCPFRFWALQGRRFIARRAPCTRTDRAQKGRGRMHEMPPLKDRLRGVRRSYITFARSGPRVSRKIVIFEIIFRAVSGCDFRGPAAARRGPPRQRSGSDLRHHEILSRLRRPG